jgi:hypothetical protein
MINSKINNHLGGGLLAAVELGYREIVDEPK